MSLLTHSDAVPWGESIKAELMAGHMPPWGVGDAHRFRNVQGLTARELNVLLAWASGGTPAGGPGKAPVVAARERAWPLGQPDAVMTLPEVTLAEDVTERVEELTIAAGQSGTRWLRALDLLPGTPAVVRAASIAVKPPAGGGAGQLLALWVPGDHPVALPEGAGFRLPAGAGLVVRILYRKTWKYEGTPMTDRSVLGLYFSSEPVRDVRTIDVTAPGTTLRDSVRTLAVSPGDGVGGGTLSVIATRPDGTRQELIALRPRAGWARRYWFRESVALPAGTRIDVHAQPPDERLLPPGALPRASGRDGTARIALDVVPAD